MVIIVSQQRQIAPEIIMVFSCTRLYRLDLLAQALSESAEVLRDQL
jgi:hypothetical protein